METLLAIAQIVLGGLLVTAILLQNKGSGLGAAFGGGGEIYQTRRGAEKTLYISTIVLAILFMLTALLNILLQR